MKKIIIKTILSILTFIFLGQVTEAQTTYQVNGRTLHESNGRYYSINNSDTLNVDTQYITIKFKLQMEQVGQSKVTNTFGLQYIGNTANMYFVFKITGTPVYHQLITDLNNMQEIDQTILSYLGNYMDDKPFPNDPGDQYFSVNQNASWWVGSTYDELLQTPELEYLNLRGAWQYTTGDPSVKIGIIDQGNDWTQTDMPTDNTLGWNFVTGTNNTYPDHSIVESSHGTKLTSIICSKTNNNLDIFGVAGGWQNDGNGVKPIMIVNGPVLVAGGQGYFGPSSALTPLCIDWAVQQGARVINMSFGWLGLSVQDQQLIKTAIDNAMSSNGHEPVICIASSGFNTSGISFPASYAPVIAVGGVDVNHWRYNYGPGYISAYGPELDFVTSYESYYNQGNTPSGPTYRLGFGGGTSFSAAMLSGVVGLMLTVNPCLTPDQVFEALKSSCYKTTNYTFTNGWNINVGYGFPNAKKAVEMAMGEEGITLNADQTWHTNRYFRGNIIIPAGKKLTLQDITLKMWQNTAIIVEKGGFLQVNNSTITSNCIGQWKGIFVNGDQNLTQFPPTNHGQVNVINSTIEKAITAIETSYGGAIIYATNSIFRNNSLSVWYKPYQYPNLGRFTSCIFTYDQGFEAGFIPFSSFIRLNYVTGINFVGCTFKNEKNPNPFGTGIFSLSSGFTVDGICSSGISPCADVNMLPSVFNRMLYGIYAMLSPSGFKVDHSSFISNNCGIYASGSPNVKIWKSSFQIPSNQDPDPRGAYINGCSGFHIEGDTFRCNAATHGDEVGLYLRNTGSTQNYVYNNTFTNLFRGTVADGENRHATASTGLCYKCNDFSNNAYDIDIVRDAALPLTNIYGISRYQGLPSGGNASTNRDTLAASNTFSINPYQYNIHNINNPSNYYYQEDYPYNIKISPNPVLGINKFCNYGTTYSKSLVCKSWINSGGSIGQELAAKNLANSNAGAADQQVQNTVDGGNTTNLTFDILGSSPPEALTLRDQLLQQSPYLSDTVMKSAIEQENVLPNAMVRDILTENPQAAKSEEIMSMLDERWDPMPDYMKEEIETGKNIIGGREQLEAIRDGWMQQESFLTNRIISSYLGDTVNPNAINELKAFLQNENTIQSSFELADICLKRGDYTGSSQAINTMQTNFSLSEFESQQATDYLALSAILAGLQTDTIALSSVDSVHAIPLLTLTQSGDNNATAMARDILIASGMLLYQEPINIGNTEKSAIAQITAAKPENTVKRGSEQLSISPNPATTYTIVEYSLPVKASNASISIYNTNGVVVWQQDIKLVKDQVIVDLSSIPSGSYMVSLQSGKQTLTSKSLSVSK